jgi:hypothetical protein
MELFGTFGTFFVIHVTHILDAQKVPKSFLWELSKTYNLKLPNQIFYFKPLWSDAYFHV